MKEDVVQILDSLSLELRYSCGVYSKRPVVIVRGEGARVWDSQGREYIDCVGGQGTANLGHANPKVAEAVAAQARRLISCPEMLPNDVRAAWMERLCALTGMSRVFLCNSGTEAVEAALKFARFVTKRTKIVAAKGGFHGRTMGALSATWNPVYREPFQPLVPGFQHVPYNDLASLEAAVDGETAAVILEVVQGEGGVNLGTAEFLRGAQEICADKGALFIIDEVQTGFARTGKMFAFQHHRIKPDILCLAKSMAGGLPMGATLLGEKVGTLPPHVHGSTFGGNPLACAAALAAVEEMERLDLPRESAKKGAYFMDRLRKIRSPWVREVRGLGLLVGVELRKKPSPVLAALMEQGVLALTAGSTVVRFLPPLVISYKELDQVVEALGEALKSLG